MVNRTLAGKQTTEKPLIAQRSIWLFSAKVIPTLGFILITILYSRQLSYQDYGLFQSIWVYSNVLSVTISFGIYPLLLSSGLSSFFSFFKIHKTKIVSFYAALLAATFIAFLVTEKHMDYPLRLLVLVVIVLQSATLFWEVLLLKTGDDKFLFFGNTLYALAFFGWHYYVLQQPFNLKLLLIGVIVLSALKLLLFLTKTRKTVSEPRPERKVHFSQWASLGLNDIIGVFAKWIDKLVLIYFIAPRDFAVFFNGAIEIPLFGMMISVVGSIMIVEIAAKIYSNKQVAEIFRESFLLLSCITFPVFWLLFFYRYEFFYVAFEHKYDESVPIFVTMLLVLPLRINNYSVLLQCYNKAGKIVKGSVMDFLIALALMPILYHFFGLRGVALSIVISTSVQIIYYLKQSSKMLQVPMLQLVPLKPLLFAFILSFLLQLLILFITKNNSLYFKLTIAIVVTVGLIATSLYYFYKTRNRLTDSGESII